MDDVLAKRFDAAAGESGSGSPKDLSIQLKLLDDDDGSIEIVEGGRTETYRLKPLADLYGPGHAASAVDPQNNTFMPLFRCIEEEIVKCDGLDRRLTDAAATLALSRLSMSPDGRCDDDPLARRIQMALRITLSLNNYSRQEVRTAVRKVGKSVDRHTDGGGRGRGYLEFIRQFIPIGR
jgi:hypothetical protein